MKKSNSGEKIYLLLVTALFYLPLILMVIYSFNESKMSSVWGGFSLKWYRRLFQNSAMFAALGNSLFLALSASLSAGVIGTLGAWGFSRIRPKSGGIIEAISLLPLMTPEIILGVVFMAFFSLLGLPFGMTTLILAHTAFCSPYVYVMVKARLAGMDESLGEAASDLGASGGRAFFDIILPQLLPAVLSGMLLSFAMSFDDVIISIFVTGVRVNTLPIKIYTQLKTGISPEINALCALMLGVTVLMAALSYLLGRGYRSGRSMKRRKV